MHSGHARLVLWGVQRQNPVYKRVNASGILGGRPAPVNPEMRGATYPHSGGNDLVELVAVLGQKPERFLPTTVERCRHRTTGFDAAGG